MTPLTHKCAMFGCPKQYYRALAIVPATLVNLCFKHFVEEGGAVEEAGERKEMLAAGPATPSNHR